MKRSWAEAIVTKPIRLLAKRETEKADSIDFALFDASRFAIMLCFRTREEIKVKTATATKSIQTQKAFWSILAPLLCFRHSHTKPNHLVPLDEAVKVRKTRETRKNNQLPYTKPFGSFLNWEYRSASQMIMMDRIPSSRVFMAVSCNCIFICTYVWLVQLNSPTSLSFVYFRICFIAPAFLPQTNQTNPTKHFPKQPVFIRWETRRPALVINLMLQPPVRLLLLLLRRRPVRISCHRWRPLDGNLPRPQPRPTPLRLSS